MEKFQLQQMLKTAKKPIIVGGILLAIGVLFIIIGMALKGAVGEVLLWIGLIGAVGGILSIIIGVSLAKDTGRAICPNCQKYMGDTGETIDFEYTMVQTEDKYDNSGKYTGTEFSYNCTIVCPHCGNTSMFTYKVKEKNAAEANARVDNYIRKILKLSKKN